MDRIGKCKKCGEKMFIVDDMSDEFNSYCLKCTMDISNQETKEALLDIEDYTEGQIFTGDTEDGCHYTGKGEFPPGVPKDKWDDNANDDERNKKTKKRKKKIEVMTEEEDMNLKKDIRGRVATVGYTRDRYEYKCPKCGHLMVKWNNMSSSEESCPKCKSRMNKHLSKRDRVPAGVSKKDMIQEDMVYKCTICGKNHHIDSEIGKNHKARMLKGTSSKKQERTVNERPKEPKKVGYEHKKHESYIMKRGRMEANVNNIEEYKTEDPEKNLFLFNIPSFHHYGIRIYDKNIEGAKKQMMEKYKAREEEVKKAESLKMAYGYAGTSTIGKTKMYSKKDMTEDNLRGTFKCKCGKTHYHDSKIGQAHWDKYVMISMEEKNNRFNERLKKALKPRTLQEVANEEVDKQLAKKKDQEFNELWEKNKPKKEDDDISGKKWVNLNDITKEQSRLKAKGINTQIVDKTKKGKTGKLLTEYGLIKKEDTSQKELNA